MKESQKILVSIKAIKKHHTHGKRYEKASEKLTLVVLCRPFITPGYCDVAEKNHRSGAHKFTRHWLTPFSCQSVCWLVCSMCFRSAAKHESKKDKIYGNFPSAETAFPRHYALWQYFVMTISAKNGLKITVLTS